MLIIIISACLASDPSSCKDYRVPLDASMDPTKCVMNAPPHVAKCGDEHPGLVITKFQCRPANENDT